MTTIKIFCIKKFEDPKISYIFDKTWAPNILCDKCNSNDEAIIKEEALIKILNIIGVINNTIE